jgi:hypothetical protein
MSFLNPAFLFWLVSLLGLPLAIHLLNKKFPRVFLFPSIERLRQSEARRSKWLKLRHWILLLLRTCFLALLLLAFLKPVLPRLGSNPADTAARHVLIAVDHSLSMEYKGDATLLRKKAVFEAEKILDHLGPDDQVNVLLVENSPRPSFVDFSNNHGEARHFLESMGAGLGRADFNQANAVAARRLGEGKSRPELYYISDFQRNNWANVDFSALPADVRVFFIDVSGNPRENHGILSATVNQTRILPGETVSIDVTVGNFAEHPLEAPLKVVMDNAASFEKAVSVAPWSTEKISVPVIPGGEGNHLCEISLPEDNLPQDDHHFVVLPVSEKEEVLVISDDPDPTNGGAYFLQTALDPYENSKGSLLPRLMRSTEISTASLAGVRKVFLSKASQLSPEASAALAKFLFQGGGVVYFLDGPADAENLAQMEKEIGANTMPVRLSGRQVATNIASGAQQISKGDFKSRYLKLFQGTARQNLALLEFYDFYRAASTGAGTILLRYGDDSPAMAELDYGAGTMLLMNFSVSEFSSNLARQRIFPAWIQELVKNLDSDGSQAPVYRVGDTITSEIWRGELKSSSMKAPDGSAVRLQKNLAGERYAISFAPDQLGFYTMSSERLLHAYPVNTSPDESDLRHVDKDVLPDSFKTAQQPHFVHGEKDLEGLVHGKSIFQYFVAAALMLLVLEITFQWIVHKLAQ